MKGLRSRSQSGTAGALEDSARPLLQRRVSQYLGLSLLLWSFAFAADRIIRAGWREVPDAGGESSLYHWAYAGALALLSALGVAAISGRRSLGVLRGLEVCATCLQGVLCALVLGQIPVAARPELQAVFAETLFLVMRAALVPGTARAALCVGALSMVPANVLAYRLYSTQGAPPGSGLNAELGLLYASYWSALAVLATTGIHAVIYGLRERVNELGQYTLLEQIGEGGMGIVYRARHALLRRPTAVKLLPVERMDAGTLARFEREVQLTADISHPNVVAVYDFGRTPNGSFYYAMELLDGIDLQRLVEEYGPLPPARAIHLLAQAADALAQAHVVKLIHRDIKPANLFLSNPLRRPDHVTVLDFGLAEPVAQRNLKTGAPDVLAGTPLYMPPESLLTARVDERSDVYALGAVAYWLVTGTTPFRGRSLVEICAAQLYDAPELPSQRLGRPLPVALETLILECLAKPPSGRPASASAVLERLSAISMTGWTEADALGWWREHASRLHAARGAPGAVRTLTIAPGRAAGLERASMPGRSARDAYPQDAWS